MTVVLIVDDVRPMAEQYAYDLKRLADFETRVASGGREALDRLRREVVDCILLDLEMPGMDGFDVLRELDHQGLHVPVVVYTGTGDFDRCVQALRLGAYGFLDKSEPMERVVHELRGALRRRSLEDRVESLERQVDETSTLLGQGPAMTELKRRIARVAPIPSPVLILGESGVGKELVARELHRSGPDPEGPFVPLNCAALPEGLVESELFGHEQGAFTGAHRARRGAFEEAGTGTLFLDELGDLPLLAQAKLLRALEDLRATRVGSHTPFEIEARIVAATHRNLDDAVEAGTFREDLYHRLAVHVLHVPPLRDRPEDIPELVDHVLDRLCARFGRPRKPIAPEAVDALQRIPWKRNNVRQLRNAVERLLIYSEGERIEGSDVPADLLGDVGDDPGPQVTDFRALRERAEPRIVSAALARSDGHVTRAAEELGLADHASLLKVMRRLGMSRD